VRDVAYLRGEPVAASVDALLADAENVCYAHAINLTEVYYDFARASDLGRADAAITALYAAGVVPRRDMGSALWKDAGALKSLHRISLADAFCLAFARRTGGEVVTTDHHELDAVDRAHVCPMRFLR
jgi:predicted nucleic acid-binding protein